MLAISGRLRARAEKIQSDFPATRLRWADSKTWPVVRTLQEIADCIDEELEGGDFERRVSEKDSG